MLTAGAFEIVASQEEYIEITLHFRYIFKTILLAEIIV